MRILFLTEDLSSNSLGRTYALWLLAESQDWASSVVSTKGREVWSPLSGTPFADACLLMTSADLANCVDEYDLIVACKPLKGSLGIALAVSSGGSIPLIVDIDDPDLEAMMRLGRPMERLARIVRRPGRALRDSRLRRESLRRPSIVSNPWLAARYGGAVIPHARRDPGIGAAHASRNPVIAFIGTNRPHKGIDILRRAVAGLQEDRVRLVVTDAPPPDARPWESWVGSTSIADGIELVRQADIVAIPSLRTRQSEGQLPAKLMDAMLLERAVIVSDVEPMRWAVGNGGLVVAPGSVVELRDALKSLTDPEIRSRISKLGRERALEEFTVAALSDRFADACLSAMAVKEDRW